MRFEIEWTVFVVIPSAAKSTYGFIGCHGRRESHICKHTIDERANRPNWNEQTKRTTVWRKRYVRQFSTSRFFSLSFGCCSQSFYHLHTRRNCWSNIKHYWMKYSCIFSSTNISYQYVFFSFFSSFSCARFVLQLSQHRLLPISCVDCIPKREM